MDSFLFIPLEISLFVECSAPIGFLTAFSILVLVLEFLTGFIKSSFHKSVKPSANAEKEPRVKRGAKYEIASWRVCSHCLIYHFNFLKSAEMLEFFSYIPIACYPVQSM